MDKDHPVPKKVKMCPQSTKKLDCPAMVKVSRRILFNDFVVSARGLCGTEICVRVSAGGCNLCSAPGPAPGWPSIFSPGLVPG